MDNELNIETNPTDNNESFEYEEYEPVTFINEDGDEETFLHIITFNYEGGKYAALVPADQIDVEEPEVLFVQITHDIEGDAYIPVENEVLLEELFLEFTSLLDEDEASDE